MPRRRRSGIPGLLRRWYKDRHGKLRQCATWTLEVKRGGKPVRHRLKTRDSKEAERSARKILADLDRKASDGTELAAIASARHALQAHLDDFLAAIRARRGGRSKSHMADLERAITDYMGHSKADRLTDLTRQGAEAWLKHLAENGRTPDPDRKGGLKVGPASQRTLQRYRGALCSWSLWLAGKGRLAADPFAGLEGYSPSTDRRYERAPYTAEEIEKLCNRETLPLYRRAAYRLIGSTGLRRGEAEKLPRTRINLDGACVRPRAEGTKGKRAAALPLTPEAVDALRAYWHAVDQGAPQRRTQRRRGGPLNLALALPEGVPQIPTLKKDLAAAGIDPERGDWHLDLHSLRASYVTTIHDAGLGEAATAALTRHKDTRTAIEHYYQLRPEISQKAIDALSAKRRKKNGA